MKVAEKMEFEIGDIVVCNVYNWCKGQELTVINIEDRFYRCENSRGEKFDFICNELVGVFKENVNLKDWL